MRPYRLVAWFVILAAAYAWFVDEATRDEWLAAACTAAVGTVVAERIAALGATRTTTTLRGWLTVVTRVPYATVRESVDALGPVLWRAIVRNERTPGRWIALRYEPGDRVDGYGRRTLVVLGSGLTPNACPLSFDEARGRIYLHQLVRRRESAADDARYPV